MLMQPDNTERYLHSGIHEDLSFDESLDAFRKNAALGHTMLEVVSRIYRPGMQLIDERNAGLKITYKSDGSPVTNADVRMSSELIHILKSIHNVPVVSEEHVGDAASMNVSKEDLWWLVDPVDGTKSYMEGYPGFGVCVALMQGRESVLGVIMFPQHQSMYFASKGNGSFKLTLDTLTLTKLHSKKNLGKTPTIATFFHPRPENKDKMERFAALHGVDPQAVRKTSAALKYCEVAEGKHSYGGGWSPLQLWDIGAAIPIVTEAGARFRDPSNGQKIVCDPRVLTVQQSIAIAAARPFLPFDSKALL